MITIHEANATDFTTLGLGALTPTECTIEEQAGGLYELTLAQPITSDLKYTLITQGRIIKAPAPMRETPLVEIGQSGTVKRQIYKVTTDGRRLYLRAAADQNARGLHAYKPGTEVAVIGTSGKWSNVIILDGGATGWMWTANLTYVRDENETISGDTPGTVIEPRQTREQLFRIYEVETDSEGRTVTARAQHITYDLKGVIVASDYAPEDVSAADVVTNILAKADHETPFNIICSVTDNVTIDCTGRNILDIIMESDSGLLAQTGARLIRDNYDLFILPAEERDRGVRLSYGKNLLSAILRTDASSIVTRIQPAGKTKDGEVLLISDDPAQSYVDSTHIDEYPVVYSKRIEYDVVESKDLKKDEARTQLREKAQADFDDGCDLPDIHLDADFVRLDLTEDYKALANAYALHIYDTVPVTDEEAGIVTRARMTGYKYDAVLDRYESTELGELTESGSTVYGYEIGGSVSGTKIISGSMSGDKLRSLSVAYAKLSRAAVEQLSTDALTAEVAHINDLTAETINTDSLTASWAHLFTLIADAIDAGTVTADTVTAAMAKINTASIAKADIDFAQVKQLKTGTAVADQLITHDATADRYYIDKLQVRALQVLEQTVGSLTVKASDGSYYRLDIDPAAGTVVPTQVTVTDAEAASGITGDSSRCVIETDLTAADLSATNVKAINALIDKLTAGRIDVDELFAREATIGALNSYLVKAETITALEGQLDVWAAEKIRLAVTGDLTPNSVNIGSSITMDADHTEISTPYMDINVSGTDGDMHIDEDGISAKIANFDSLNCDEVVKYYTGATSITVAAGADLSAITEQFRNRMLKSNVTITLAGDVTGRVVLAGICGRGNIIINAAGHTLSGCIIAINNAVGIEINSLTISHTATDRQCVNLEKCTYVKLYKCILNANSTPSNAQGIRATYTGLFVQNCEFYNIPDSAMAFSYGTDALVIGCKGAATYFLWTDGCVARFTTSRPSGKWAAGNPSFLSPTDPSTLTIDTGSATPAEDPVTTATYTASVTGTYYPSGHWINDNVIRQGYEGSTNGRKDYGCMWFSGASALSGKTIKSATLTLKRISGKGRSSAVTVKLWSTTVTGKSGTMPASTMTSLGELGTIGNGETVTYSIPTSCIAGLASGGGLVLYTEETACKTGKSYSEHYAHFEGTNGSAPVLTVTYQ